MALADDGDPVAAAALMTETMARVPDWAAGWFTLAGFRQAAGDEAGAAEAWQTCLALDPADRLGAGLYLDLLRRVPVAETMPRAFVETLFDQYAPRFDAALVETLGYRVPEDIRDALLRAGHSRFARVMDLGCGTGLMGQAIRPHAGWLEGVDLSSGMLAEARAKGLYDRLEQGDIARLAVGEARFDLVLAADVFIYLGALERVVAWAAASLAPGGVLAFSVELAEEGEGDVVLRPSRRYAHGRAYLERLMDSAGLAALSIAPTVIRCDRGAEIAGLLVLARGSLAHRAQEGDDQALTPA